MRDDGVHFLLMGTMTLLSTVGLRDIKDPGPHDPATWLYANRHTVSTAFRLVAAAMIAAGLLLTFAPE